MPPFQIAIFIAGSVVIIVGAYYVTYYVGVKASGLSRGRNRNINLLDRFAISKDKSFCIVEIAGKVYIIGVTNQSMTLLDTLDAEAFARGASEVGGAASWAAAPGAPFGVMMKGLKSFLATLTGKPRIESADGHDGGPSFADSMKDAQGRQSGQPEDTDDPEEEK